METEITESFNQFLSRCETAFRLKVVKLEGAIFEQVRNFAGSEGKCHNISDQMKLPYAVIAYEKDVDEIASYVSYSYCNAEGMGQLVNAIIFEFSCTAERYERRGLSTLIRLLIITFAIHKGMTSVLSSSNESSGGLLVQKFGFIKLPHEDVFLPELYACDGLLINTKLILEEQYLGKYKETYNQLLQCTIVK
jgi:hypothetical protein